MRLAFVYSIFGGLGVVSVSNYSLIFGAKVQRLCMNSHVKLQCCHGNFSYSAEMVSRFENVTDYERNLSPMILIVNQNISWCTREIREYIHLRFVQNQIISLA